MRFAAFANASMCHPTYVRADRSTLIERSKRPLGGMAPTSTPPIPPPFNLWDYIPAKKNKSFVHYYVVFSSRMWDKELSASADDRPRRVT